MKYRNYLAFLLVSSLAACSSAADKATGPLDLQPSNAREDEGVKPPPPAGSEEVDISVAIEGGSEAASRSANTSEPSDPFTGFFGNPKGRYFANTQNTNGWIDFESGNDIIASPNARLSYNGETRRTNGQGTLTIIGGGPVLDLSKVTIVSEYDDDVFGACGRFEGGSLCAHFRVEYEGGGSGDITVRLAPAPPVGEGSE